MPTTKDNSIYEKTSFLSKNNDAFIESMYLKYVSSDPKLPLDWKEFFDGLGEEKKYILNEIQGPSWTPNKIDITKIVNKENISAQEQSYDENSFSDEDYEKEKFQSIKAIALIRAYRIRGHLNANLDPLQLMERKYLHDLNPSDHGFKKEDYDKKIYLHANSCKEQVQLELSYVYTIDSIRELLSNAGFVIKEFYSDFDENDFDDKTSPRLLLLANKV